MLQLSKDDQHRYQVLLKRVEEYCLARIGLVQQLEELDAHAQVAQQEFNALQNFLAPVACLPEEVLAMLFEAGTHLRYETGLHFAVLVSHVTHSWRNIALATPRLWATVQCRKPVFRIDHMYPETDIERTAAFLVRSGSSPMDLHLSDFHGGDRQFLQLIMHHFERCQHLSIKDRYGGYPLSDTLACISHQHLHFLASFQFLNNTTNPFKFNEPLFPSGVPLLKTAQIRGIDLRTSNFHFCIRALQSITSLNLIYRSDPDDAGGEDGYAILRDSLMALPFLIHLELEDLNSVPENPSRLPLVLPTLQSLRGYSDYLSVLSMIHAASLTVLILKRNTRAEDACEFHFPSLQHLVLRDLTRQSSLHILSQFPSIERLTFLNQPHAKRLDVHNLIAGLGPDGHEDRNNGHHIPCPRLRTLALSPSQRYRPMDVAKLVTKISSLQDEGVPIGKLMLPKFWLTQAGAELEAFAELRKCVEIVDFRVDWPTPFASERFTQLS